MKLALDANIVIYAIEDKAPFHTTALNLFRNAPSKNIELHISELTFLEVLARPDLSDTEAKDFYEIARRIASYNHPIDTNVLLKAAELRRKHKAVKAPDAIHLATAIVRKCDYFVTDDKLLHKLELLDIAIVGLRESSKLG